MRSWLDLLAYPVAGYAAGTDSHRGKARFLRVARGALGVRRIPLPGGVVLPLLLDSSMDMSYVRVASGEAPEAAFDLVRSLRPGDCFVDIGANVGFHTAHASRAVGPTGRVLSVEPSSREYVRLRETIALNGCSNTISFHAALADATSVGTLHVERQHTGLNHLSRETSSGESVPIFRGDDLLTPFTRGFPRISVKIDVEGAEGPVIAGLSGLLADPATDRVVVEVSERFQARGGTPPAEIYARMEAVGLVPTVPVSARTDQYDEVFVRA